MVERWNAVASLNIKNERAVQLIKELAARKGLSLTAAVTEAVQAELERVEVAQDREGLAARLMALGTTDPGVWKEPHLAYRHGDLLYDDHGLPK